MTLSPLCDSAAPTGRRSRGGVDRGRGNAEPIGDDAQHVYQPAAHPHPEIDDPVVNAGPHGVDAMQDAAPAYHRIDGVHAPWSLCTATAGTTGSMTSSIGSAEPTARKEPGVGDAPGHAAHPHQGQGGQVKGEPG